MTQKTPRDTAMVNSRDGQYFSTNDTSLTTTKTVSHFSPDRSVQRKLQSNVVNVDGKGNVGVTVSGASPHGALVLLKNRF